MSLEQNRLVVEEFENTMREKDIVDEVVSEYDNIASNLKECESIQILFYDILTLKKENKSDEVDKELDRLIKLTGI